MPITLVCPLKNGDAHTAFSVVIMEKDVSEIGVSQLVNDELSLSEAVSEIKKYKDRNENLIAVDSEGNALSRKGELTILILATKEKVYIFDVLTIGESIFSSGLKEILEDGEQEKLMFDCRQDSDALWHQFNIKLAGVLDLQLLEIMFRRESESTSKKPTSKFRRRSKNTEAVEKVNGYSRCLELYLKDEKMIDTKNDGAQFFKSISSAWKIRPLPKCLIQYCIVDTMGMFRLYDVFKHILSSPEKARLRIACDKYTDYYRGKKDRKYNEYENNGFLPLDIIAEKGTTTFAYGDTTCTGCDRKFPREEFSFNQLGKGVQKCRVCKKVKLHNDVQKNREDNWAREEELELEYACSVDWQYEEYGLFL